MPIRGSCLCQGVVYEIAAPPAQAGHCHCSMCRKWSGSALQSYAGVKLADFRWARGEELLVRFPSSPGFHRVFCGRCGSSLAVWPTDPAAALTWVMLGTLDGDPGTAPTAHIFVGSKAPWFGIADDLEQHAGFPG